ncbi:MAG: hypothetical protein WCA89_18245 [Terracidiphilus sp.]
MRAIIRFSLDSDPGPGDVTSKLRTILKRNHLARQPGTGTYEGSGDDVNIDSLRKLLNEFFDKIKEQGTAKIDHFWMYFDKEPSPKKEKAQSKQTPSRRKAGQGIRSPQ